MQSNSSNTAVTTGPSENPNAGVGAVGDIANTRFTRAKILALNTPTLQAILKPTSDISRVSVVNQSSSTAYLYKSVDDGTNFSSTDNETTFIRSTGGYAKHQVGYSGGPSGTFNQVIIHFRARTDTSNGTAQVQLYNGNLLIATAPVHALGSSYTNFSDTLKDFTVTNINNLRSEILIVGGGRYTQTWIEASYLPANEPGQGAWTPSGNLDLPLRGHTATLLTNGKVLIAGGDNEGATMGVYNPATGLVSGLYVTYGEDLPTGSTATRLMDGRVLVVGGTFSAVYSPFHAGNGGINWTTGDLEHPRTGHTATLLADGKVLITGGMALIPNSDFIEEAELFDPALDAYIPTGSLNLARSQHFATRLPDGRVLIAGGSVPESEFTTVTTKSAEIYDPVTGSFHTTTGEMLVKKATHQNAMAPVLGNGKVLFVGGDENIPAELFDPATETFSALGNMMGLHDGPSVTLLSNGKVLIAGGYAVASRFIINTAELYDPVTNRFSPAASMNLDRYDHTATLLPSGKVLVTGGFSGTLGAKVASTELYSFDTSDPAQVSLKPTFDVSRTSVTSMANSTASMYLFIDDGTSFAKADDDSTYLLATGGTSKHRVGYSGGPSLGTNQVVVHFRARTELAQGTAQALLYNGSTLIGTGPVHTLSASYANFSDAFVGLNVANVNNLRSELVLKRQSSDGHIRYTATWIQVSPNYTQAPAQLTSGTSSIEFGAVNIGTTSEVHSFVITNVGQRPSGTLVVASSLDLFSILTGQPSDCVSGVTSLAAAASCTVRVTFSPTAYFSRSRAGMITFSAIPGGGGSVALRGTAGTCPVGQMPDPILGTCAPIAGNQWIELAPSRSFTQVASSADGSKLVVTSDHFGHIYTSTDYGATWTQRQPQKDWVSVASSADGTKLLAGTAPGYLYTSTDSGVTWTQRGPLGLWGSVASSADGVKLLAADPQAGFLYTSADSGATWVQRTTLPLGNWQSVASSASGEKLVAAPHGGNLYISTDSGATWTPHLSLRAWRSVVISADGTKIVVAPDIGGVFHSHDGGGTWSEEGGNADAKWSSLALAASGVHLVGLDDLGRYYTSNDLGQSFYRYPFPSTQTMEHIAISADGMRMATVSHEGEIYVSANTSSFQKRHDSTKWAAVASSADGHKLLAATYGGYLYTSTNAGMTWTQRHEENLWTSVASSDDGQKLVAVSSPKYFDGSFIHTSTDGGINWVKHQNLISHGSFVDWTSVASSSDGMKLLAVSADGFMVLSTDGGATWGVRNPVPSSGGWLVAASSADGSKLAAASSSGYVYTSSDGGTTWIQRPTEANWHSLAFSADGSMLVATQPIGVNGGIYGSTDLGVSWTLLKAGYEFRSVAVSSDGSTLLAAAHEIGIFTSTDGGTTWTSHLESLLMPWSLASLSENGTRMIVLSETGAIYNSSGPVP